MKRKWAFKYLCLIIGVIISFRGFAQDSTIIHLWPGEVPGEQTAKHPPVVMDNHKGNVTRITDITNPAMVSFSLQKMLFGQNKNFSILKVNCRASNILYKRSSVFLKRYEINLRILWMTS